MGGGTNTSAGGGVDQGQITQLKLRRVVLLVRRTRAEGQCVQRRSCRQPVIDIQSQLSLRAKMGWFLPNGHNLKASRWQKNYNKKPICTSPPLTNTDHVGWFIYFLYIYIFIKCVYARCIYTCYNHIINNRGMYEIRKIIQLKAGDLSRQEHALVAELSLRAERVRLHTIWLQSWFNPGSWKPPSCRRGRRCEFHRGTLG